MNFFWFFSLPRIKHYKVMSAGKNYTIDLEKPVSSYFLVDFLLLPPKHLPYRIQSKVEKQTLCLGA